ncbi:hypothetical protein SUGI_0937340 [Cryptomeria japonica]|nr:hypothetical protein SUGI_0937340 [Cryptomeria japonica]
MADKNSQCMSVRLLISKKNSKIVYAEAGKDFVDLLLSFLTMPLGSVMKLLSASGSSRKVGSVTSLYVALEKLPAQYMNGDKSKLLDPKPVSKYSTQNLLIENLSSSFYICKKFRPYGTHSVSTIPDETCVCGLALNYPMEFSSKACQSNIQVTDGGSSNGYVKGTVTFMITDDLNITPSSTITCIKLLNQLNARDREGKTENKDIGHYIYRDENITR